MTDRLTDAELDELTRRLSADHLRRASEVMIDIGLARALVAAARRCEAAERERDELRQRAIDCPACIQRKTAEARAKRAESKRDAALERVWVLEEALSYLLDMFPSQEMLDTGIPNDGERSDYLCSCEDAKATARAALAGKGGE